MTHYYDTKRRRQFDGETKFKETREEERMMVSVHANKLPSTGSSARTLYGKSVVLNVRKFRNRARQTNSSRTVSLHDFGCNLKDFGCTTVIVRLTVKIQYNVPTPPVDSFHLNCSFFFSPRKLELVHAVLPPGE